MTDMQEILANLIISMNDGRINADVLDGAMKALSAVPEIYHVDAVKALLKAPSEPEEQPEDYLAVKTFTSPDLHVGDEVAWGEERCVIYRFDDENAYVFGSDTRSILRKGSAFRRTGRNFPAVQAILDELKKP